MWLFPNWWTLSKQSFMPSKILHVIFNQRLMFRQQMSLIWILIHCQNISHHHVNTKKLFGFSFLFSISQWLYHIYRRLRISRICCTAPIMSICYISLIGVAIFAFLSFSFFVFFYKHILMPRLGNQSNIYEYGIHSSYAILLRIAPKIGRFKLWYSSIVIKSKEEFSMLLLQEFFNLSFLEIL